MNNADFVQFIIDTRQIFYCFDNFMQKFISVIALLCITAKLFKGYQLRVCAENVALIVFVAEPLEIWENAFELVVRRCQFFYQVISASAIIQELAQSSCNAVYDHPVSS